jgi:dTDP-glucose 4,6-dehydratase
MTSPMPTTADLLAGRRRILVTGGAGFIGGAVVRRLLQESDALVFNLDKCGYASDLTDAAATAAAVQQADPDLVMHLAAESHVDRSIEGPGAFIDSNVSGTFQLLQTVRAHWEQLPDERQTSFRFHHISTDEVFGSLGPTGRFSENTPYDPRSPYSASKAASDHLVSAWHHTYDLPVVLTNCSNNYGPWQFPEKPIPLYGDGANVRDWLYVEDHVDALLLAATQGTPGRAYCVGGHGERTNKEVVEAICSSLDDLLPAGAPHSRLVTPVTDRPGHDRRYAIDPTRISSELGWQPRHSFEEGLAATVDWYLDHLPWCRQVREQAGYGGDRLGVLAGVR